MSLAPQPIPVTVISDPRTTFEDWSLPCRVGGSGISYLQQQANSANSNLISFDIRPPNWTGSVIGPEMIWYNKVTLTIVGAAGSGNLLQPGVLDAPRAFPFTSVVDSMRMTINGTSFDIQQNAMIGHVLRRFNPRASLFKEANYCPWYPDSGFCRYQDVTASTRNPLGSGSVGDLDFTRGAYQKVVYTPTAGSLTTNGTVVLESWEPLNISPLMYEATGQGLPYVSTLHFDFNISNIARLLSHSVGTGGSGVIPNSGVTASAQTSYMYYQMINYPLLGREVKPIISMPFYSINPYLSQAQIIGEGVPALGSTTVGSLLTTQSITLPCVPSRIYVFAQPQASTLTMQHPDFTYMYCGNLNVLWNGITKMQNVQPQQLYSSAVDAGYAYPWENFNGSYLLGAATVGSSGSVICLRPGTDFDLPNGQAVGQAGPINLQISGNWHDQSATGGLSAVLWVVAILPGVCTLTSAATCNFNVGVISEEDVLTGAESQVSANDVHEAFGSGVFDTLKKSLPFIQRLGKLAHNGLSAANNAGLLGNGLETGGSSLAGGASMYGGSMLSKKALMRRLR
jgi:hypothetical protein